MNSSVSVVVLAKDERRCIARCLTSLMGKGFDRVVVVDTGSTDGTLDIAEAHGAEVVQVPWRDSFAAARNHGIDAVAGGWIVFLDADEWFAPGAAEQLVAYLRKSTASPRTAFAPTIFDVVRESFVNQVPRIFRARSGIRYRGRVHEYPAPIDLVWLDVEVRHDGYRREVVHAKKKTQRNLSLLDLARADEPDNPRWLYFIVHDGLPFHPADRLIEFCAKLEELTTTEARTGDHLPPSHYLRLALPLAAQGIGFQGDWDTVARYCARIDELDRGRSPDAQYLRAMAEVADGVVTVRTLKETIATRRDEELLGKSTLSPAGTHLDAAIAALLERLGRTEQAEHYRAISKRWDDLFFEESRPRTPVLW
ncbi:glycosyltransferase family 2 protein [Amycolatopsis sp. NPDC003865]